AWQGALADWLKEADVVVIPTRTTSRDIEPLMRMRKAVFKHSKAKIVYVMNGWNRFKASRDFMEWFDGLAGVQTVVKLPQSEAFVQAGAAEQSVVEYDKRGKAARATMELVNTVRDAAGFPME
ncbi:chromosome partitioning protein, partial [[Clostridium] innocuum]|nr:chromosome partitioning protein [[Clostridium] innocuum]